MAYLRRLNYDGPLKPNIDVLRALHRAHMLAVPFENLDISIGRPIVLDEARMFDKIVRLSRGGFCYELNGAFAALLREIGFSVTMLSCRVAGQGGRLSPEFDHLALRVDLGESWLADVGFGDSFLQPLRLEHGFEDVQVGFVYRLTCEGERWSLSRRGQVSCEWEPQYTFNLVSRQMSEFTARCQYHQTSPESHFTKGQVCSLATETGRITLAEMKLIETEGAVRRERVIADQGEYRQCLRERFGVVLGD